jgi:hypothetical protein
MDVKEREKHMCEILQGMVLYLYDRFLDKVIKCVEISETVRLKVERSNAWRTYTRHTGAASANIDCESEAVTLIQVIVRLYATSSNSPLRKEYFSSASNEVPYHAMSVAPMAHLPELEANRNLKPDLYSRIMPAFQQRTDMAGTLAEVEVQFDLKSNPNLINSSTKVIWPSALKSRAVLQDGLGCRRSHALVAIWSGNLFLVAVFDRGGGGMTPAFDITEDTDRFIRCMIGFLSVDESRLGLHSDAAANTFTVTLNKTKFVVERAPICVPPYPSDLPRDNVLASKMGSRTTSDRLAGSADGPMATTPQSVLAV